MEKYTKYTEPEWQIIVFSVLYNIPDCLVFSKKSSFAAAPTHFIITVVFCNKIEVLQNILHFVLKNLT